MPTRLTLKYLLYTFLGLVLLVTQSYVLLALIVLGFGFSLAIQARLDRLHGNQTGSIHFASGHWVSDGGSFPGHAPKTEPSTNKRPIVIDGGSLEHHNL